jgi:Protein of unknown function (DUF2924)
MARPSIEQRVAALGDLSRPELAALWQKHYGCAPPLGVRKPLLVLAAAWQMQSRANGGAAGLSTNGKRLFKAALKRVSAKMTPGGMASVGLAAAGGDGIADGSATDSAVVGVIAAGGSDVGGVMAGVGASASDSVDVDTGVDSSSGTAITAAASSGVETRSPRSDPSAFRTIPLPGARLIRDWNGKRYVVDIVENGFVMDGKTYKSLTAIAFLITGTRWSGPRFFGL